MLRGGSNTCTSVSAATTSFSFLNVTSQESDSVAATFLKLWWSSACSWCKHLRPQLQFSFRLLLLKSLIAWQLVPLSYDGVRAPPSTASFALFFVTPQTAMMLQLPPSGCGRPACVVIWVSSVAAFPCSPHCDIINVDTMAICSQLRESHVYNSVEIPGNNYICSCAPLFVTL